MGSRARAKRRAAKAENHPPSAVQDIGKRPSIQTQIQGDYHPISSFRCKCLICIRTPLVVAKDRGIPVFVKPKEVVGSGSGCTALFTKLAVKPRYYQPVKKSLTMDTRTLAGRAGLVREFLSRRYPSAIPSPPRSASPPRPDNRWPGIQSWSRMLQGRSPRYDYSQETPAYLDAKRRKYC